MKKINLKEDHLQIYKRENSNVWQIKIKLPHKKALRITSRTKILEDAKKNIQLKVFTTHNKNMLAILHSQVSGQVRKPQ